MNKDQREIQRKLRILRHADETGHVAKTCRYFGIGRSSFYRWREAYRKHGDAGLVNHPPIPKWHANRTPIEIEEKVLHLRSKYHLGPMRIVWYLARYHGIKVSDATVSRILKRNGVNRLPRCNQPPPARPVIPHRNGNFQFFVGESRAAAPSCLHAAGIVRCTCVQGTTNRH